MPSNFVENCTISHNDHLALGDYSRMLNFKIADLCYVNVTQEVINVIIEKNSIQKSTKDAPTFGVLLFKRKI